MMPTTFETNYHCNSFAMCGKASTVEDGDKILLPPSALHTLAHMNVEWPMLFRISNDSLNRSTHCGVLEFTSEEGRCYVPYWMMENLCLGEGSLVTVTNVSLPKATYAKFRAQNVDFLEIDNHRAVLEVTLRKYTCLTKGDIIQITYADKNYGLEVTDLKPNNAVSIIETDMNTEFDEPVGYKESKFAAHERGDKAGSTDGDGASHTPVERTLQKAKVETKNTSELTSFKVFGGTARRIDGKAIKAGESKEEDNEETEEKTAGEAASGSVFQRKSLIGSKYSKRKSAATAFSGTAHKL